METYLFGLLEQLKCGYYSDVTNVGQLLGKKRKGVESQLGTLCLYQAWRLVISQETGLKAQGQLTSIILLPTTFLTYQSFQEGYNRK